MLERNAQGAVLVPTGAARHWPARHNGRTNGGPRRRERHEQAELLEPTWSLDEAQCPCDLHFLQYLEEKKARNTTIFHFGTGNHHIVGLKAAEDGVNNAVLGITASPQEYDDYVELLIKNPRLGHTYKAYFGDIYQLDARLLPQFDYVTPVPPGRVPHARQRQLRRPHRPGDDAAAGRQG